ncbi:hypothetical protein XENOCAPTIV_030577 [Xenoophorus captivus]|uniref:Uncharacterized protein n=1 Tax=Xenoophorus captivus TaxID=1517983 RepID=A0ABV0QYZ2_9TELE
MYSVEDLLISHGYKLPKSGPPSAASYDKRPADCQRELVENRAGRGTLNGYEAERGASITGIYSSRQALVKGYPTTDECMERIQRRKEAGIGILVAYAAEDDPLTLLLTTLTNSGLCAVQIFDGALPMQYSSYEIHFSTVMKIQMIGLLY